MKWIKWNEFEFEMNMNLNMRFMRLSNEDIELFVVCNNKIKYFASSSSILCFYSSKSSLIYAVFNLNIHFLLKVLNLIDLKFSNFSYHLTHLYAVWSFHSFVCCLIISFLNVSTFILSFISSFISFTISLTISFTISSRLWN